MKEILNFDYNNEQKKKIDNLLDLELKKFKSKVVILDDDPTGTQTVNNVKVYCDWEEKTLNKALESEDKSFFILTNSRSFSINKTIEVHKDIMNNLLKKNKDILVYSRGDSTLRGHYPIETEIIKNEYEKYVGKEIDGEIICPFFLEGKRITIHGVHYILEKNNLIPVGESEFSKDKTFPYKNSNLLKWCEEKTNGKYKAENMINIRLEDIREMNLKKIEEKIYSVKKFNKIIVDSINYYDLKIFLICLFRVNQLGKKFIIRGAASLAKILIDCKEKNFLKREDILNYNTRNGGLILIGSHVSKTTKQLEKLKTTAIKQVEFNQHLVLYNERFKKEIERVINNVENFLLKGKDVVVYTRRERIDFPNGTEEEQLKMSTKISDGLIEIVKRLKIRPAFIISKGGITSSDTATKGLGVKKAIVLGQIAKGVPVWLCGEESKYDKLPYIIFPGNVGEEDTLKIIYEKIMSKN